MIPPAHAGNRWRDALKSGGGTLVLRWPAPWRAMQRSAARQRSYQGEIYELYLDPIYQGLGLWRAPVRGLPPCAST
jgi:hypothetical protein